jgi:type VI secretion system protein ImpE
VSSVSVKELFDEGNLGGAIDLQTREVKANPGDAQRRTFLFELLAFAGDLERAERQLDVIGHQDAKAEPAVQVYRNILHAEQARRRLFGDGLEPEFLGERPNYARLHLEALNRLREGRPAEAKGLLDESETAWPPIQGEVDGTPVGEFRDCDDVLAPFLELIVLRSYVWLPLEQVREIEIPQPERPRDLLWTPVRLVLADGAQHRGYVPVLYCGSHAHADDGVRLGRKTDWRASDGGPVQGEGHRLFLTGDEGRALLSMRSVKIATA